MQITEQALRALLAKVQKPARYAGQEWNSVAKDWELAEVRLALAYPDVYEIGMCNLGLAILYDLVNKVPVYLTERVYAPWEDMIAALQEGAVPLFSLETRHALGDFDVLGFSLQHELTYSNVLLMLDLAGLPLLAAERAARAAQGQAMPLVIAGGSCTYNPEPMADYMDVFVIGEGEEVLLELLEAVRVWKHGGSQDRPALLRSLARIEGLYVPSLYAPRYAPDGAFVGVEPIAADVPARVRKRILARLGPAPTRPVVPTMQVVHDRANLEIQRGCSRGCRFCQAGIIYRPIRERPVEETLAALDELLANTGYNEVGLVSLSSSDHSGIAEIVARALERYQDEALSVSLPSLRIDSFSVQLAEMIQTTRKTGLTFAPEAGSQRLRDVINKGVTEDDLLRTTEAAFRSGWNRIKLYFMIGLPTETDEDVLEIARLVRGIHAQGRGIRGRAIDINVTVSTFVPKPHTPFQWAPLASLEVVRARQALLRDALRIRGVHLSWSEWDATWLEALLSRGDRRLGRVILRAWRAGSRFDAWSEFLVPERWKQALAAEPDVPGVEVYERAGRDTALPWEHIASGVTRDFLWREFERAREGELTPDCRQECCHCGILSAYRAERAQAAGRWGCP